MSAGTGVLHSEFNLGKEVLRFLQIWILPDKEGCEPNYGDYRFEFDERRDKWLPIAAWLENKTSPAPIKIHQDINAYASLIPAGASLGFETAKGRQAYLVLIEGDAKIDGAESKSPIKLAMRDAAEISEENITISAETDAHILVIEMAKA
jgi:redox-sensitive bicupin YhaK (pirin superfamily)